MLKGIRPGDRVLLDASIVARRTFIDTSKYHLILAKFQSSHWLCTDETGQSGHPIEEMNLSGNSREVMLQHNQANPKARYFILRDIFLIKNKCYRSVNNGCKYNTNGE